MDRCCQEIIGAAIQDIFLVGYCAEVCCINLIITRASAAVFKGTILRSCSVLLTDQFLHQHHYLRHYTKQVVAKNSPDIGICQKKLRRYLKVPGTLLYSTQQTVKVKLICLISFRSGALAMW